MGAGTASIGIVVEAPYGATNGVRGVPKWVRGPHTSSATGAFGGAPCGATILARGVPKWPGTAKRVPPLGPQ
eukprot:5932249-Pyramimonas_sp.AAC.1